MDHKKRKYRQRTSLQGITTSEGKTIEQKIALLKEHKEQLTEGDMAQIIYTDKADGVLPSYNIRTDRWEVALDGLDRVERSYKARSEDKATLEDKPNKQGTDTQSDKE